MVWTPEQRKFIVEQIWEHAAAACPADGAELEVRIDLPDWRSAVVTAKCPICGSEVVECESAEEK